MECKLRGGGMQWIAEVWERDPDDGGGEKGGDCGWVLADGGERYHRTAAAIKI